MSIKSIAIIVILFVVILVGGYSAFLLIQSWPIESFSIEKAAVFGDSFGILNSLFSGLAFVGIIITILLQRDELRLQRIELARSSSAQEQSARLTALSQLLSNYNAHIAEYANILNTKLSMLGEDQIVKINKDLDEMVIKKNKVLLELELLVNKKQDT